MTFEDYISGQDKDPLRFELKPDTVHKSTVKSVSITASAQPTTVISTSSGGDPADKQ